MEPFHYGVLPVLSMCLVVTNGQYQDMVCEEIKSRQARKMTEPGPECDMSSRNWCSVKTDSYPEKMILEVILDNRGIMKRLFGDQREARFLENAFTNQEDEAPTRPPPRRLPKKTPIVNGKFPHSEVLASARHGKKIYSSGSANMHVKSISEEMKNIRKFNKLTPTRFNDKLFSKTFEFPFKKNIMTTQSGDLEETTQPTTVQDDMTTLQDFLTLEAENTFATEPTTFGEENLEITTETEVFEEIEDELATTLTTSKNVQQVHPTEKKTTVPSIDSGDDFRYTTGNSGFEKQEPIRRTNSIDKETGKDQLEGRVEYPEVEGYSRYRPQPPKVSNRQNPNRPRDDLRPPSVDRPITPTTPPPPPPPQYHMEKFPACNSTTEMIAPTWAKNIQGKNLIVINVGSFMQHLHVEECEKSSRYRKMFCQRGCRCEQQYRLQKLLVMDPDDECRGIFSDWFRFPSCCVCVCYPASMSRGGMRNGRIIEEEFDDFYPEEEDDEFVDHYFGVDLENEEQDMAGSASQLSPSETSSKNFFRNGLLSGRRRSSPEKKSRLLGNLNRTINIRPQVAPRRRPPPRTSFSAPWSKPLWGLYRTFPPASAYHSRVGLLAEARSPRVQSPSIVNANVDTYYNQNKPTPNNSLKRIPRSTT